MSTTFQRKMNSQISIPIPPVETQDYYTHESKEHEQFKSIARRLLYHPLFKFYYLFMGILSLVCLVLSLAQKECPTFWFFILEFVLNVSMITEVSMRYIALEKQFWDSIFNKIDLGLALLCIITLAYIYFGPTCSSSQTTEQVLEQVLLIIRNVIAFSRSIMILQRYILFFQIKLVIIFRNASLSRPIRDVDLDSVSQIPLTSDLNYQDMRMN